MRLTIQFALAVEFADQSLATEKTTDKATAGFAEIELERVFERNDVPRVDDVFAVDVNLVDRSETVEQQIA